MLTVAELREMVRKEFGQRLERATPATVRDFLDRIQLEIHEESGEGSPYVIEEERTASSYEEIIADFFSRVLDYPPEKAVILLWLLSFEQHFTTIEEDYVQRALTLFGEGESD